MRQQQPGVALAQQVPDEVEVVVVQQHGRLPTGPVDLLRDGVRDQLVGCDVALLPRGVLGASQARLQGQPVQPVLHEPQQRVGDHPVERFMHLGRDLHQTQRHRARPGRLGAAQHPGRRPQVQPYELPGGFPGDRGVGAGRRDADPHRLRQIRSQAGERGDQPTGAAVHLPLAAGIGGERHRTAVRQHHYRQAEQHISRHRTVLPARRAATRAGNTAGRLWSACGVANGTAIGQLVGEQDAPQGKDTAMSERSTLLGIYLNDHLAGAK